MTYGVALDFIEYDMKEYYDLFLSFGWLLMQ